MRLTTCLVASDMNKKYLNFFPFIYKGWKEIVKIDIKMVLIGYEIPSNLEKYKDNIILFKPIKHMKTSFQAQCIRLLYPALIRTDGAIIISDMDMMPVNRGYYHRKVKNIKNNKFVLYRNKPKWQAQSKQYLICYNAAHPKTWREIFKIENEQQIRKKLKKWYKLYRGRWTSDQEILFSTLNRWNRKTRRLVKCDVKRYRRLNRRRDIKKGINNKLKKKIIKRRITDFHMFKPPRAKANRRIIKYIFSNNRKIIKKK